jgi:multicomponent Na+:H+ antiporter subunit G
MSFIIDLLVSALMLAGAACALLAAVGIVRMPDLFTRLQASSKAATLGAILALSAVALHFGAGSVAIKAVIVILFLALTTPVGAHCIARAAYCAGERMADAGARDEWAQARAAGGSDSLDENGTRGGAENGDAGVRT